MKQPRAGQFIKAKFSDSDYADNYLVDYSHMNGKIVSVMGLGKSEDFPILVEDIVEVFDFETAFSKTHGKKKRLWMTNASQMFITYPVLEKEQFPGADGNVAIPNLFHFQMVETNIIGDFVPGKTNMIGFDYQLLSCPGTKADYVVNVAEFDFDEPLFKRLNSCDISELETAYDDVVVGAEVKPFGFVSEHDADIVLTDGNQISRRLEFIKLSID